MTYGKKPVAGRGSQLRSRRARPTSRRKPTTVAQRLRSLSNRVNRGPGYAGNSPRSGMAGGGRKIKDKVGPPSPAIGSRGKVY